MRNRLPVAALTLTVGLSLLLAACGDSNVETVKKDGTTPPAATSSATTPKSGGSGGAAGATASAAGVSWSIPEGWAVMGPRPMRAATYLIGEGDNESECAVFFFGTGQGGDVQSNISRWIGQFQQPDGSDSKAKAQTGHLDVNGLHVTTIDLTGTYMSGGMMGQAPVPKPGFRLLGAIVEAPEGPLFFKLTGPEKAIAEIKPDFDNLIANLKKS